MTREPDESTLLGVVLASPPLTSGARTFRQLEIATRILGYNSYQIANLFPIETLSIKAISQLGESEEVWEGARSDLRVLLQSSESVLLAYGVSEPTGAARVQHRRQVEWLISEMRKAGHDRAWQVGSPPRHPSRWHQYASDRHGRTKGGTFIHKLTELLVCVPIEPLHPL